MNFSFPQTRTRIFLKKLKSILVPICLKFSGIHIHVSESWSLFFIFVYVWSILNYSQRLSDHHRSIVVTSQKAVQNAHFGQYFRTNSLILCENQQQYPIPWYLHNILPTNYKHLQMKTISWMCHKCAMF